MEEQAVKKLREASAQITLRRPRGAASEPAPAATALQQRLGIKVTQIQADMNNLGHVAQDVEAFQKQTPSMWQNPSTPREVSLQNAGSWFNPPRSGRGAAENAPSPAYRGRYSVMDSAHGAMPQSLEEAVHATVLRRAKSTIDLVRHK